MTSFMCCPGVFTVDFGLVLHLPFVVSLLTLGRSVTLRQVVLCAFGLQWIHHSDVIYVLSWCVYC